MARIVRVLEYYGDEASIWELMNSGVIPPIGLARLPTDNPKIIIVSDVLRQLGRPYAESPKQRNSPTNSKKSKTGEQHAKRQRPTAKTSS